MTPEELETLAKPLVGKQLLAIELVDFTWFLRFSGDIAVQTDSAWRLIDAVRVVVTSEDNGHPFGLPAPVDAAARVMSSTVGQDIVAATIQPKSGDLRIEFNNGVELQLLQMSCGYEAWSLTVGRSETLCLGGGEIVHFAPGHAGGAREPGAS